MPADPTTVVETHNNPGCLLQILWFAFIGIWLGLTWMVVAWIFMVTIVGIPIGIGMLNMLPKVMALREPPRLVRVSTAGQDIYQQEISRPQAPLLLRVLYFLLVGWWLSALWMLAAYLLCLTIIGLPIGFWMFDLVPAILTLRR